MGLIVTVILVKTSKQPVQSPVSETSRLVRIIEAPVVDLVPGAVGSGSVVPGVTLDDPSGLSRQRLKK